MNIKRLLPDLWVWLLFAVITGVGLTYHVLWRDEWQAILLAYKSHSLSELWNNTRDEGHPMLWYLVLYTFKFMGPPAIVPKLINYVIALGYAWVILRCAPFSRVARYALIFGYFFIFEYVIISRNYAISILLIFSIMSLWQKRHNNAWLFGLLLFLLTQTTIYGSLMALSFTVVLFTDVWLRERKLRIDRRDALFTLAGVAGAVLSFICASRVSFDARVNVIYTTDHLLYTISTLYDAYFPIPELTHNCWNSILPDGDGLRGILGIVLLIYIIALLYKHKQALLFWFAFTASQLAFSYIYFLGYIRHMGYLYMAGIVACWFIFINKPGNKIFNKYNTFIIGGILLLHISIGAYFNFDNLTEPFVETKNVTDWLQEKHLAHLPIYGSYHYCMTGVSGYLNKPILHIDDMEAYTFMPWKKMKISHGYLSDSFLNVNLPAIIAAHDSSVILLTYMSPAMDSFAKVASSSHVQYLQRFDNSNELFENYFVYLVKR